MTKPSQRWYRLLVGLACLVHLNYAFPTGTLRNHRIREISRRHVAPTAADDDDTATLASFLLPTGSHQPTNDTLPSRLLIHWRGEGIEGYSLQFRHWELAGALEAVTGRDTLHALHFHDALEYTDTADVYMSDQKRIRFNNAMQYVEIRDNDSITMSHLMRAVRRCALVHALYLIASHGKAYEDLAEPALLNGSFDDMQVQQSNQHAKWCIRVRQFGQDDKKGRRHGDRTRSVSAEQQAIQALRPVLVTFGGAVDLKHPDCKIYIFDGLKHAPTVLTRRLAVGPTTSIMAPATRICVTNTPLCPIAAYSMCNIAGIRSHQTVLDPYGGSCAILLAAALLDKTVRTVAIDVAHNGLVNRFDIRQDFVTRQVPPPLDLLRGDCADPTLRTLAREVIRHQPFDHIITDPPYGIRESSSSTQGRTPIQELCHMIATDRDKGTPLLRVGGKLVVFIPCRADQTLHDVMPTNAELEEAGLVPLGLREQPLNDNLSRWLVAFQCVR